MVKPGVTTRVMDALAVIAPVSCAGCGAEDRGLCAVCRRQLAGGPLHIQSVSGVPVTSALEYGDAVRRAILAFKEHDRTDLARAFAPALLRAIEHAAGQVDGGPISLCSIPSSRRAWRRRGYRPVDRLLSAAHLRADTVLRVIPSAKRVQKGLSESVRWSNRHGSFIATRHINGRRFVLIDDVVTTGATLTEAARAISQAGGVVVGAATLAFTPRKLSLSHRTQGIRA